MKRNHSAEDAAKRKSTNEALWILLLFILLFVVMIFRVATRSGSLENLFSSMPSGNDAYKMAVSYIKPTLGSREVKFAASAYQFTKRPDSVYVVKSYFETSYSSNKTVKTNFVITLKYVGGTNTNEQNWSVLNLEEHQ